MTADLPIVCIPGLGCSARLYAEQIPQLWSVGPVTIAQHRNHDSIDAIARSILASAPARFALIGLSMGGYLSFEILRQAPERVVRLALLDTSARPDAPEQTESRRAHMRLAEQGRMAQLSETLFARLVHPARRHDEPLREVFRLMMEETGAAGFIRQQRAIIARPDSRPSLGHIRCPTLVVVGDADELTPPALAAEMAEGIDGARLLTVPQCGHLCTLERPRPVTDALMDLLRG
ncbi:MAG: alpha/beta fold hydrolase [Steroidobacteraceae bacterium]|nr:alpha/beta fold hydrolase [Steroidobacteraceae bacterium]